MASGGLERAEGSATEAGNMGRDDSRAFAAMVFGAFAIVTACSSFDGDGDIDPKPGNDAGAGVDVSVGGEATGEVVLGVAGPVVLTQDTTLPVDVTIDRKPPFDKGFTLTAIGLPAGVTIAPVDVSPLDKTKKIEIQAAKTAKQGALGKVTLEARNQNELVGSVVLAGAIRGKPGDLDTTFGKDGVVTFDATEHASIAMRDDGAFYILKSAAPHEVRKFTKDGVLDTTFATAGVYTPGIQIDAIAWKSPDLLVAGANGAQWQMRRLDGSGNVDANYGVAGTYERPIVGGGATTSAVAFGLGREAVIGGARGSSAALTFITATGTVDIDPMPIGAFDTALAEFTSPANFRSVVRAGANYYSVGRGFVTSIGAAHHEGQSSFGTGGLKEVAPFASLVSVAVNASGQILFGGVTAAPEHLLIGRISAVSGAPDVTFGTQGTFDTGIATGAASGPLALAGDKIVQVATIVDGSVYRCVLVRYTKDGAFDTSFGQGGKATMPMNECYAGQVAVQADGRIVVAGTHLHRVWN